MSARWWLAVVVAGSVALTLLVSVTSAVSFAYRSPTLHVAVETAAAIISLFAAQLMYGRFRRSLDMRDLWLTAALVLFAGSNLLFSAVPAMANAEQDPFTTWAPAVGGTFAALFFAIAAFSRPSIVRRPATVARRVTLLCVLLLVAVGALTAATGDRLPIAISPDLSPEAATRPRIVGDPVVLGLQLLLMALFALAAFGFARRSRGSGGDPLTLWLAIAATLAAFARLNYFLFPSRYSEYFYTGDVLRLGFFIALLAAVAGEIRLSQRELQRSGALDERRRIARDIHDGMAQDLAFIVQQAGELERRNGESAAITDIATAARRALDESRGVIAALARPADEPFDEALVRVANDAAGRLGATIEAETVAGIELPATAREAVLRIVGEAVTNAARHGHADVIRVEVREEPQLCVRVIDEGDGFDPAAVDELHGRHGINGMRERAAEIGAQLDVRSRPGSGTTVRVVL